jgi:hypothetical protein
VNKLLLLPHLEIVIHAAGKFCFLCVCMANQYGEKILFVWKVTVISQAKSFIGGLAYYDDVLVQKTEN